MLSNRYNEIELLCIDVMSSIWQRSPRSYQLQVIVHIVRMMLHDIPPSPVLLVQSTGSGKSTVPLTCAVVNGGVSIVLENTLALSSDQSSKVINNATDNTKHVKAYQLDNFKGSTELKELLDSIASHCTYNQYTSIIIFASPEAILKKECIGFIAKLIDSSSLNLFCIDKVHQFIELGISFRKGFQMINKSILSLFRNLDGTFKIPILMMTATLDYNLYLLLQRMLG